MVWNMVYYIIHNYDYGVDSVCIRIARDLKNKIKKKLLLE